MFSSVCRFGALVWFKFCSAWFGLVFWIEACFGCRLSVFKCFCVFLRAFACFCVDLRALPMFYALGVVSNLKQGLVE
jgi:hypothetical protein